MNIVSPFSTKEGEMIQYDRLKNKQRIFRSLSGLSKESFEYPLEDFEQAERRAWREREVQRVEARQRQAGGGREAILLSSGDRLLFILFYFKFYPIQEVLAYFFGLSQPQANAWAHRLTPLLNRALGYEKQLPARKTEEVEMVLAACPGLEFIIDGTERRTQRPKDSQRQKDYYSGKKRCHSVKNRVISEKSAKKVKALGATQVEKKHDKAATDEENYRFPQGSKLWKETGFQGYEPTGVTTYQPKKKPKGKELTPEEKAQNKLISQTPIGVEQTLGGIKVFHIARDVYRNHKTNFEDLVMETACGLHNLRMDFPLAPWSWTFYSDKSLCRFSQLLFPIKSNVNVFENTHLISGAMLFKSF